MRKRRPTSFLGALEHQGPYLLSKKLGLICSQMPGTKDNLFKYTILFLLLAEALSYISFVYPIISPLVFGLVSVGIIIATVYKLEYGIMIIFSELIIGSLGKMFILDIDGFSVSIRMVIWLVLLLVWVSHAFMDKRVTFFSSKLFRPFAVLALVVLWGIAWGAIRGNSIGALFSDVNNYLYFLLIFPVFGVLRSKKMFRRLFKIIVIALTWLSIKTIILFYIFSHEFFVLQNTLYAWSRWSRLAEITNIDPTLLTSRIFMQSHIWLVFAFFLFLGLLYHIYIHPLRSNTIPFNDSKKNRICPVRISFLIGCIVLFGTAILASFSRSFWLAGIITLITMMIGLFLLSKLSIKNILGFGAVSAGIIVISIGVFFSVANFPIPKGEMSLSLLKDRAAKFSGEAAVTSRYAQIRPLFEGISKHPVLGSGFGTSVTYESQDPRVLRNNADGLYTSTAFELGWLEMWLKIGLLGVLVYLFIIFRIFQYGIARIKKLPENTIARYHIFGGLLGLLAVVLTHGVSPYLNHPLGIGIVILIASVVDRK